MYGEKQWVDETPMHSLPFTTKIEIDQLGTLTLKVVYVGGNVGTLVVRQGHYELKYTLGPDGYVEITLLRCEMPQPLLSYVRVYNYDGSTVAG